ncbi:MAG TPA: RNA polymerase sigma factor [Bryobacteraceae bacterium]|nr:RNA polymerase sigma factor [Bryobacteraceae bacterium]
MGSSDGDLMLQVRRGNLSGLAELFERYHKPLYRYFLHLSGDRDLSEDLAQEAFFRVLKHRDTFDARRPFSPWLYQIARNLHMDQMRKRKLESIPEGHDPAVNHDADEKLGREQELSLLRRALDRLPLEKREVLVLSRFQNMKYEDIAVVLNCEVGTVKTRVFRAMRALSESYRELSGAKAV